MAGLEYPAAAGIYYESVRDYLQFITAIYNRFHSRKRNQFGEPEYGNIYARSIRSN